MLDIPNFFWDMKPLDPFAEKKGRIALEWDVVEVEVGLLYRAKVISPFTRLECEYNVLLRNGYTKDGVHAKVCRICYSPELKRSESELIHEYKIQDPPMNTSDLIRIAEEHFYDEVERYKDSNSNAKPDAVTNEQDDRAICIEVPAGKTIQITITTKDV